jgi:hypothetical protein
MMMRQASTHHRLFAAVAFCLALAQVIACAVAAEPAANVEEKRVEAAGVRKLASKHLTLFTDVPANPDVDGLPAIFDQAVPQWARYFGIDESKLGGWQAKAYLIGDRRRFEALRLMPPGHPDFVNGISMGAELWLLDQPTAYYRRHLLLHEGTHVFMSAYLGGSGPGWYMEGVAELLGTHRLDPQTGKLTLGIIPRSRDEVPMLGRIKLIRDAVGANRTLTLPAVMKIDNRKQLGNEAYAWCWAAAKFLDSHPRYLDRFRELRKYVLDPQFNEIVRREYADDWSDMNAEWQAYIAAVDHGYDFERMAIEFRQGVRLADEPMKATIAADRGWQSSGVLVEAGKSYVIAAAGQFQIAEETADNGPPRPWSCEPGGVTIEYHDGRPLGMLLAAIDSREAGGPTSNATFAHPAAIGLTATIRPTATGTLYLRVNDSAARLDDNRGTLTATIGAAR